MQRDDGISVGVQADPVAEIGLLAHAVPTEELADRDAEAVCGCPVAMLTMVPSMSWESVHPRVRCTSCVNGVRD